MKIGSKELRDALISLADVLTKPIRDDYRVAKWFIRLREVSLDLSSNPKSRSNQDMFWILIFDTLTKAKEHIDIEFKNHKNEDRSKWSKETQQRWEAHIAIRSSLKDLKKSFSDDEWAAIGFLRHRSAHVVLDGYENVQVDASSKTKTKILNLNPKKSGKPVADLNNAIARVRGTREFWYVETDGALAVSFNQRISEKVLELISLVKIWEPIAFDSEGPDTK